MSDSKNKKRYKMQAIKIMAWESFLGGVMIAIGCTANLSCDNKYIGALLFTVALCGICNLYMHLFTGEVWKTSVTPAGIGLLLLCGVGNLIGCAFVGWLVRTAIPEVSTKAVAICNAKLEKEYLTVFILALLCGILMTVAVKTFKIQEGFGKYTGIFTCVPAFILCGFEHSIADIGYFFIGFNTPIKESVLFILCVMIGNVVGGLIPRN